MSIDFKRHAALGTNFTSMDAMEELRNEGLKAADVEEIVVHATQATVSHGDWLYEPTGLTSAQMNLGFCVATMLVEGEVFVDQMVETNIARPDLVALARLVKAVRDPAREQMGRDLARGSRVEVRLKDGRTLSKTVDFFLGSHHRPFTDEQVIAKFRKLASRTLPPASVARIEELAWGVDRLESVADLSRTLRG
jgi:aconitate decarboxylase